jgi:hypothetical protein
MKCRIDIKEGLIKQAIDKYETKNIARTGKNTLFVSNTAFRSGKTQAYQVAQNTVNRINKEYEGLMAHRREVFNGQEILIDPSNNLVSIYYNDYLKAFPGYTESKPLAVKTGVEQLFESNPELAKIGTPEQYSQYLDTIFPDSKVKDIVYHGTDRTFEQFSKDAEKATISDQGMFFAPTKNQARNSGKNIIKALINSNPLISDNRIERISEKKKQELLSQGYTGYVYSYNKTISSADDIVVFEPEQIHILGNKQDIKGFREFVSLKSSEEDARKIQEEDAKRAGIKYGDRYMFEEERPDAYFDYEKELLASTDTPVEQNIFEELSNLNFTNEVIEYLYNDSSKRLSIEKFAETVKMFAANLRGMGYTNEEVLEHIKCL